MDDRLDRIAALLEKLLANYAEETRAASAEPLFAHCPKCQVNVIAKCGCCGYIMLEEKRP